jgi:hypothetical protein
MEMGVQVFTVVALCCWVSGVHCLEGSRFLHLQGQEFFLNCLILEDEGTMKLQNIWCHSPGNTASHPEKREFSVTLP